MSDLDIINFLMIDDVKRSTKNQHMLMDMQGRADYLARKTGHQPMSWYEFQQLAPQEEPRTLRNLGIGVMVGGALGALVGLAFWPTLPLFALGGAFIGGAIGAFSNTEATRRNDQLRKYGNYLDQFERVAGQGFALQQEPMPSLREGANVERLRKSQEALATDASLLRH